MRFLYTIFFGFIFCTNGFTQDLNVEELDEEQLSVFLKNEWVLHYGEKDNKYNDFVVLGDYTILIEEYPENYILKILDRENLEIKSKKLKKNKKDATEFAKLVQVNDEVYFGPVNRLFYKIDMRDLKFEKLKNSSSSLALTEWYVSRGDNTFSYELGIIDKKAQYKVFMKKKGSKQLKEIYGIELDKSYVERSSHGHTIEVQFLDDQLVLLDNHHHKILVNSQQGDLINKIELEKHKNVFYAYKLVYDQKLNRIFLLDINLKSVIYEIYFDENSSIQMDTLKISDNLNFNYSTISELYLYTLIYDKNQNMMAIYKKKMGI